MKIIKVLIMTVILLLTLFIFGCIKERDPIVEKLAHGQALSAEEQSIYAKDADSKKSYDEEVQKRKAEIVWENYRPPTEAEVAAGKRQYIAHSGSEYTVDITPATCQKLGFLAGSRVNIPKNGEATVVGVDKDGDMWFHVDGVYGATYWPRYDKNEFVKAGFVLVPDPGYGAERTFKETVRKDATENASQKPADENEVKNATPKTVDKTVAVANDDASNSKKLKKLQPIQPIPSLVEE